MYILLISTQTEKKNSKISWFEGLGGELIVITERKDNHNQINQNQKNQKKTLQFFSYSTIKVHFFNLWATGRTKV